MKLVVDAGSTGTQWALVEDGRPVISFRTGPINPSVMDECAVRKEIEKGFVENISDKKPAVIEFYGSGCRPGRSSGIVRDALLAMAPEAEIGVYSDMLGACRAALGDKSGIVCILGTGSNVCRYDGHEIIDGVPSMGYILGDEGGGADIGRRLVNAACKRMLPNDVTEEFFRYAGMDVDGFIERVYRQPGANTFLAGLAPFALSHRDVPEINRLVTDAISDFFAHNVVPLNPMQGETICSVGSVGWLLCEDFRAEALKLGLLPGKIIRTPLAELMQ